MLAHDHFSIIIPTFREAKNIPPLIQRIAAVDFGSKNFEVIIVDDDSQDGIEETTKALQRQYAWLKLFVRKAPKSLSGSAMTGFQQAQYPLVVLMDADLSHPPEKIPALLNALSDENIDFALGSRYVSGGSTDEAWPILRKLTSLCSALMAQALLSIQVKDPLSGFFALRKITLAAGDKLNPIGWKIGLEIMLKCHCKNIKEIPIHFSQRLHGDSKLNFKVALNYFYHFSRLLSYKILSWQNTANRNH